MYSLVEFDNQEYYITRSKKIKIVQGRKCFVKYKGGSTYSGYLISTNDSEDQLKEELNDRTNASESLLLTAKTPNDANKSEQELPKKRLSHHSLTDSCVIEGTGCSTPNSKAPPLSEQIRLSIVPSDVQNTFEHADRSTESSAPPSEATEIMNSIGDDWLNESTNNTDDKDIHESGNNNDTVTDDPSNKSRDRVVSEEDIDTHREIHKAPRKDDNGRKNNGTGDVNSYSSIVEGTDTDDPSGVTAGGDDEVRKDSDYAPSCSVTAGTSQSTRNESSMTAKESFDFSSVEDALPIDSRELHVPTSKYCDKRTTKKHFCPYCKKLQTKFARHLEIKHKEESEVQKFIHFPKGTAERVKIIEKIRKWGNFLHNTNPDLNTGILISCRQPQAKFDSTADDYICCSNCKGFFSKQTLRIHYTKCNPKHEKGSRGQTIQGRRMMGYIHNRANDMMRRTIFPSFHDDQVSRSIKYDELLILFGNKLCDKYTLSHQSDMIRSHLRLLSRFKCAIKKINKDVDDFASVFHPRFYDDTIKAVRECAKYDPETKTFKTPANATSLGTLLKKCGRLLTAECIKREDPERKKMVEDFLLLFDDDFPTTINRKVVEDQSKRRREKKVILPTKQDIRTLYDYLEKICQDAMKVLDVNFNRSAWQKLTESTLILVQMFNRRRPGEIERLLIENYENQETIDKSINPDMYQKVSDESQEHAKQFVRLTIRGKLGRTVPVLVHTFLINYIDTILRYRTDAGVASTNKYVFAVPHTHTLKKEYLRACPLMRKFADECGASMPSTLRGTTLRKHIATYTAMLRIEESRVSDLANFMGHDKQIHKDVYRVPNGLRDMTEVSRLLQAAMGDDEEEEDDEDESDDGACGIEASTFGAAFQSRTRRNNSTRSLTSTADNRPHESTITEDDDAPHKRPSRKRKARRTKDSDNDASDAETPQASTPKRRSTSPYGKTKRVKWSDNEKKIVEKHFGDPSTLSKLPSLSQCQAVIDKYDIFRGRTSQQLKTWIDNQRKAPARKKAYNRRRNYSDDI